ncbi:MAG: hypothetical protein K8T91_16180 [Planctomycetes bacterium]|nr:hypothetical protein [Planctomycetota bacterium]
MFLSASPIFLAASEYDTSVTEDAKQLMDAAVKAVSLKGSFCPAELGAKIGLDRFKAIAAARWLSNAGVLELGFDNAAYFTREYRTLHTPAAPVPVPKAKTAVKTKKPRSRTPRAPKILHRDRA